MRASCSFSWVIALLLAVSGAGRSQAAAPAFDDSTSSDYDDGWDAGDNGGSGFGDWVFALGLPAAFDMGTSTANGDGDSDLDGDIDVEGTAFGITTSTSGLRRARRPFASPFEIGEIFSFDLDADFASDTQQLYQASIELLNASHVSRLRVGYFPGAGGWGMTDGGGFFPFVGLPVSDEGVRFRIERTSATTFSLELIGLGVDPYVQTGTFASTGDIVSFQFAQNGPGTGPLRTFANSFQVAPEPGASAAVIAVGALAALTTRRRSPG